MIFRLSQNLKSRVTKRAQYPVNIHSYRRHTGVRKGVFITLGNVKGEMRRLALLAVIADRGAAIYGGKVSNEIDQVHG